MSKYSNTFELVKKHWPIANLDESDLFFMKIVDVCSCANYDENNIEKLCSLISDFYDDGYQKGIYSVLI